MISIEIPDFIVAAGSVQSNGVALWAVNCTTASGGAGSYTITLDGSDGIDSTQSGILATVRSATAAVIGTGHTSDTVKTVTTATTLGAATNFAFDFVVYKKPGS